MPKTTHCYSILQERLKVFQDDQSALIQTSQTLRSLINSINAMFEGAAQLAEIEDKASEEIGRWESWTISANLLNTGRHLSPVLNTIKAKVDNYENQEESIQIFLQQCVRPFLEALGSSHRAKIEQIDSVHEYLEKQRDNARKRSKKIPEPAVRPREDTVFEEPSEERNDGAGTPDSVISQATSNDFSSPDRILGFHVSQLKDYIHSIYQLVPAIEYFHARIEEYMNEEGNHDPRERLEFLHGEIFIVLEEYLKFYTESDAADFLKLDEGLPELLRDIRPDLDFETFQERLNKIREWTREGDIKNCPMIRNLYTYREQQEAEQQEDDSYLGMAKKSLNSVAAFFGCASRRPPSSPEPTNSNPIITVSR